MPTPLLQLAQRAPDATYGSGASEEEITKAATSLGVTLPSSYLEFLREVGWFESPELTVYGLGLKTPASLNLIRCATSERKAWQRMHPMPEGLIPISPDGRGGCYCLDTSRMNGGECPVVYWDHELIADGLAPERAAQSFSNYFRRFAPKPRRKPKGPMTFDRALAQHVKAAKRAGLVGDDVWRTGDRPKWIKDTEKRLGVTFPEPVRRVLKEVGGFEHAGGWWLFGTSPDLPAAVSIAAQTERVRRRTKYTTLVPLARSWRYQLCCVDLASEPLHVVALDTERLSRRRGCDPLPFEEWLVRIGRDLDPWHPV